MRGGELVERGGDRHGGEHHGVDQVGADHDAAAVDPVGDRSGEQAEHQVRQALGGGGHAGEQREPVSEYTRIGAATYVIVPPAYETTRLTQ